MRYKFFGIIFFLTSAVYAKILPLDIINFPEYQNLNYYGLMDSKPLMSSEYQKKQWDIFCQNYFASWNDKMLAEVLPIVRDTEFQILDEFNNAIAGKTKQYVGINYKTHSQEWWSQIKLNMHLSTFNYTIQKNQRAITVNNTLARALPTTEPAFFDASLPGQGYPFDNLQDSAIWAGTPIYVVGISSDHAWALIITPEAYFTWIPSRDLAFVSNEFISQWQDAVQKNTAAITQTAVSILDEQTNDFHFYGYIGAIFPLLKIGGNTSQIMLPVRKSSGMASTRVGIIPTYAMSVMPLRLSRQNMLNIITQLHDRQYGWGGMLFFNDCSQELKSLFTPFGIWLPRNSSLQGTLDGARDLSHLDLNERLKILAQEGHPFLTIIYTGAHVMLYLGQYNFAKYGKVAMTYQNVWGLHSIKNDWRYVIGKSIFLPLVAKFPGHPELASQADYKIFSIVNL